MNKCYVLCSPYTYGKSQNNKHIKTNLELIKPIQSDTNYINVKDLNNNFLTQSQTINNLDNVYKLNLLIKQCLLNKCFTLMISSDHSTSIGSIGSYNLNNTCLLWIDAHADINNEETSISHNAHGMPLGILTGQTNSILKSIPINYINDENIFWIGTRSIDTSEYKNIKCINNMYDCNKIHQCGLNNCLQEIETKIKQLNVSNIYISFDVDVIDPNIISAVSTPVTNGLSLKDIDLIIKWCENLKLTYSIIGVDFVEYDSRYDLKDDYIICKNLCEKFFQLLNT